MSSIRRRIVVALAAAIAALSTASPLVARSGSAVVQIAGQRSGIPSPPVLNALAAVVIDAATGTILYAKNPDLVIPPASLAKLVTLHVIYEEIAAGRLSKDEILTIDKRDCSPFIPYGSSLMYLRPGMRVSVLDLMLGTAVVSGNDAAFALARRISGSNEAFAERMTAETHAMGFPDMSFVEPSGLSELNRVTAREFAYFCKRYLDLHPQSLAELHSIRYIEFPRPEHATVDYKPSGRILQYNRNDLVLEYPGCDGLKTGYIIEAGYNLAATAAHGDSRFILVTLGGTGESSAGGGAVQRSQDGAALLDWAFASFVTLHPQTDPLVPIRTWFGSERRVALVPADKLAITLPKAEAASLTVRVETLKWIDAPIARGDRLGEVVYSVGGNVLRRVDLVSERAIPRGNFFNIVRDGFEKFFAWIFGRI